MSSNDLADTEGAYGERTLEHDDNSHDMGSCVVLYPNYVTYGQNRYRKAQLTFYNSIITLSVTEEGAKGSLNFEWKTVDLISIESRWLDPSVTAEGCLRIKPENPNVATSEQKSGLFEVTFTVSDPHWTNTEDRIKVLDEQYKEKWDVDLDSYDSFQDIMYLEGDSGSISISKSDFQLLEPEKFINDTIVDFYIEYLKKIKPADARVHFFNSFFFRKLEDLDENRSQSFDANAAFQRVRKWTKKVNVFQTDYIFIPVNFRLHWSLIVICHPGEITNFKDEELANSLKVPCILHMDSIRGSHRGVETRIKHYLFEEWKERNSDASEDISTKFMSLRYLRLEVPQQQNCYDCALFMLHYMERFVKQLPINFNPETNFISKDWFLPIEASLKRARIKRLIFELAKSSTELPRHNDKSAYELKDVDEDEEEADIEILNCNNTKESCFENVCESPPLMVSPLRSEPYDSPIMVTPLRSEPYFDCDMDIDVATASVHEIQSDCENDREHGQLVVYDPSINIL
ncbi:probable ubiquitin-like-specific protease 2B isoform X2 [Rutidosis leptorrhynchoides]